MPRSAIVVPAVASCLANVFLGVTVVATRYLVADSDPLTLAFIRNLIAAVTLLPLLAGANDVGLARGDILPVLALGAAQFGVFPLTFTTSLELTTASRGALVFALVPMFTLLFASLLGIEALTRFKAAGALLALTGVLLSVGQRFAFSGGTGGLLGELFMLITVVIGAGYNSLSRSYLSRYRAHVLVVYFMWSGVLLLAPFALTHIVGSGLPAYNWWEWLLLAFTGTFGGSIGYFLFVWALQNGTPARVAMFVPMNPITATILGTALLGESLTGVFLIGLLCVVVGIVLANVSPDPVAE